MKQFKKILEYLLSPFALGIVVTLLFVYTSLDFYYLRHHPAQLKENRLAKVIEWMHEKSIDWRLNDRGPIPGSPRVAILAIDEASIEAEGRWPWSRAKMAKLVEKTLEEGAKSISFDIIFSEADSNSAIPTLTQLRRNLRTEQKLDTRMNEMILEEIKRADSDRIFAQTISKYADQLIMGSYFEATVSNTAHQDLCLDALFSRTYESKYWQNQSLPLTVIDEPLNKLGVPTEIKDTLNTYFTQLEVTAADTWFQNNPEMTGKLSEALKDLNSPLPPEAYPGIATLWLNNDIENLRAVLEEAAPNIADQAGAELLLRSFASAFQQKEKASLQEAIRYGGGEYCHRFLNSNDDLADLSNFQKTWGESEDVRAIFDELGWGKTLSRLPASDSVLKNRSITDVLEHYRTQSLPNSIANIYRWWVSIPELGAATKHSGYFNAAQDSDGSIRRSYLLVRHGNSYMPSLSLKTFLVDQGYSATARVDREEVGSEDVQSKVLKDLEILDSEGNTVMNIPVDEAGRLMINYAGGRNMFPYVRASDLLSDKPTVTVHQRKKDASGRWVLADDGELVDKKTFLKDKLLIAGATALGVYDLRVTPFEENYPGVETHANVLSNLLIENDRIKDARTPANAPGFLRTHPGEERIMWIVLLVSGVVLSALISYFGSVAGLGVTALFLGVIYGVDKYLLFNSGVVTTVLFPIMLVSGNFVALTSFKYFTEERKKRALKGTFEKYVSPAIVAEVLADPENIELGGKKMELTVMFSDVRGFTTISEKLDPRALSDLLNSYLTPMTNLVFANKGTLDKYMGDAIMAFWGAPIHFADHAQHACRCALQMIDKLKELQAAFREQGLPEIDIGIGLNTGEMSVGNMGSDTVRSYTVMGDAVNLGSRLEGINKQYGTRIIISEFTYEAIKDKFTTREVDWVRVKGKLQPVRIFELMSEGKADAKTSELLKFYNQGFTQYHQRDFQGGIESFKQALNLFPDDAVSQLYLERCQDYLSEPPPADWDGVYTMTSK